MKEKENTKKVASKKSTEATVKKKVAKKVVRKKPAPKKIKKTTTRPTKKKPAKKITRSVQSSKKKTTIKPVKQTATADKQNIEFKTPPQNKFKALALGNSLQVLVMSPYRFPLSLEQPFIQVARVGGIAFVAFGVLFSALAVGSFQGGSISSFVADSTEKDNYVLSTNDGQVVYTGFAEPNEKVSVTKYELSDSIEIQADASGVYSFQTTDKDQVVYVKGQAEAVTIKSQDGETQVVVPEPISQTASVIDAVMAKQTMKSYESLSLVILALGVVLAGVLLLYLSSHLHLMRREKEAPGQGDEKSV